MESLAPWLSRHRVCRLERGLPWVVVALAILVASAPASAESTSADLIGTWFVVVHYHDEATSNPDADRWEDKVWVFERKGSRLQWTEYPIVVFEDRAGRFEVRGKNQRARTLSKWMPNEGQRAAITDGPRVNSRGSKSKGLRGSDAKGYESSGALRAQSASVIGYHETWSIEDVTNLPVFTRMDVMGMGRSKRAGGDEQDVDGITRYATVQRADGDTLKGSYVRDENRRGEFTMMRAGTVRGLSTDGKSPNEKLSDRIRTEINEQISEDVRRRAEQNDPEAIRQIREHMRNQQERRPSGR